MSGYFAYFCEFRALRRCEISEAPTMSCIIYIYTNWRLKICIWRLYFSNWSPKGDLRIFLISSPVEGGPTRNKDREIFHFSLLNDLRGLQKDFVAVKKVRKFSGFMIYSCLKDTAFTRVKKGCKDLY